MQNGPPENGFSKIPPNLNAQPDEHSFSTPITHHQIPPRKSSIGAKSLDIADDEFEQNDNDAPPAKKRKLTDTTTRQVSTSRQISPPWKRIAVEGPTSFVEGGRRKSSRTNFVPLELQPQAEKRQTRAAIQKAHLPKSRYGGASTQKPSSLGTLSNQTQTNGKQPQSSGKATSNPSKSPAKPNQQNHMSPTHSIANPTPFKRSHRKKKSPISPTRQSKSTSPHKTRRSVRSSETFEARNGQIMVTNGWDESEEEANEAIEDEDEEEEEDEPVMKGPNYKPQRLNLRVRMPTVKVQHPGHVALPRRHPSFRAWFENDELSFRDNENYLSEEKAEAEGRLRTRIIEAAKPGGILSTDRCSIYMPDEDEWRRDRWTHRDHLLAHAINLRMLMEREQKKHRNAAKKIAQAAAVEWRRRQPKTDEEIKEEQRVAGQALYTQLAVKGLRQKWDTIAMEVERRRRQRFDEEQSRQGKQALNKVLEQSSQLLDRRRLRGSSNLASDEDVSGDESEEDDPGSQSSSENQDEDNMSSSQSDSQEDQNAAVDDDEGLTLVQLRHKYSKIPVAKLDPPSVLEEEDAKIDVDPGGADLIARDDPQYKITPPDVIYSEQMASVHVDEVDDILIDNSDASTDMDEESDDNDDMYTDDDSEESEEAEDNSGLLGFFSKNESFAEDRSTTSEKDIIPTMVEDEDFDEEDEAEEVILIPDAAQVQTPSASNSEDLFPENRRTDLPLHVNEEQHLELAYNHQPVNQSISNKFITEESLQTCPTPFNSLANNNQSLPTTPVSTNPLKTAVPCLLRGTLREYQHFGLDWLAGLYANGTNGILADEMGLGKTIQTIALLAHLAVEHEVWGPHLIVVPTSVLLNWEVEFKKFLPGFKVLTYYGTQEERRRKRQGWMDKEKWHVWITSYPIILADCQIFRRRGWHYLVLDEAHNIKNFRSQRWQTLLTFKTRARLLLTGTPLQNNLTELWSLLFFLMPTDSNETGIGGFADLQEFTSWFRKPVEQILETGRDKLDDEGRAIVSKLHRVLRPFLLRRLKADVEKQMPGKTEHVISCRLSKRQRYLYDGFMSRSQTRETLASGNYLSIINCLMQLRKVCNHPDLFETRQIVTSFAMPKSAVADFEIKELLVRRRLLQHDPIKSVHLGVINLCPGSNEHFSALDTIQKQRLGALGILRQLTSQQWGRIDQSAEFDGSSIAGTLSAMENTARRSRFEQLRHSAYLTSLRSQRRPLYSYSLMDRLRIDINSLPSAEPPDRKSQLVERYLNSSSALADMVPDLARRSAETKLLVQKFACVTPKVVAADITPLLLSRTGMEVVRSAQDNFPSDAFHEARMRLSIAFPDKRLLQYDCGKLQELDTLLRNLQAGGHRALIFTQMTRVLDILEQFLNIHGYRYFRLDGATKIENRQILTERFNNDPRIPVFILSSRSGGLGINLTGADTVIFYDLDWNPAMDKQCQDRCHRIGQTRDVHIYRFVCESTIEANILRKANQKRMLDDVVIQEGEFTTDYFNKLNVSEILADDHAILDEDAEASAAMDIVFGNARAGDSKVFEQVEDQEDIAAARIAEKEMAQTDAADFEERAGSSSVGVATPKTPGPQTPRGDLMPLPSASGSAEQGLEFSGIDDPQEAEEEDEEGGHVDEYMLRFVEWDLKDVPIFLPPDKNKKKSKKGGELGTRRPR